MGLRAEKGLVSEVFVVLELKQFSKNKPVAFGDTLGVQS